jgi:hypothetical protein
MCSRSATLVAPQLFNFMSKLSIYWFRIANRIQKTKIQPRSKQDLDNLPKRQPNRRERMEQILERDGNKLHLMMKTG